MQVVLKMSSTPCLILVNSAFTVYSGNRLNSICERFPFSSFLLSILADALEFIRTNV